ncbi:MAG: hypothetical protein ABIA04_15525 [Pseudomonadota bacterium]
MKTKILLTTLAILVISFCSLYAQDEVIIYDDNGIEIMVEPVSRALPILDDEFIGNVTDPEFLLSLVKEVENKLNKYMPAEFKVKFSENSTWKIKKRSGHGFPYIEGLVKATDSSVHDHIIFRIEVEGNPYPEVDTGCAYTIHPMSRIEVVYKHNIIFAVSSYFKRNTIIKGYYSVHADNCS